MKNKIWCAFQNGEPVFGEVGTDDGNVKLPELFGSRKVGLKYFDDVREIKLVEVKK